MIGGIVTEVIHTSERTWINCVDRHYANEHCAIYVKRCAKSECITPGDTVWWQSRSAMWTPLSNKKMKEAKCGRHYDIKLERIGYSGVKRPS